MASSAAITPRTWLITGASSGIGNALTRNLVAQGERVVATARDRSSIAGLEEQHPGIAFAVELDVTVAERIRRAVDAAVERLGRVDVVVSNAGYGVFGALEEFDDADLRRQLETNFFGVLNLI